MSDLSQCEIKNQKIDLDFLTIFIICSYVSVQIISNIASSKIANVFNLAVDAGTFLYPLAFTLRDLAHKKLGKKTTLKLIMVSAVINILTPVYFFSVSIIKPDISYEANEAFKAVLSPVIRISIASIIAATVAEIADTSVYQFFVTKITKHFIWLRVLISNAVSVPIDNLIFVVIAFFNVLPTSALIEIFIFNFFVKYAVSVISMPAIYLARGVDRT